MPTSVMDVTSFSPTAVMKGANETAIQEYYFQHIGFVAVLLLSYVLIFVMGICGNLCVIVIVLKNKQMREYSTNLFIANLGLANICICCFSLPITPVPIYFEWRLGPIICSGLPVIMAASVFMTTYVSMAIAIDRYIQIARPFQPKMKQSTCLAINAVVIVLSFGVAIPFAFTSIVKEDPEEGLICDENWPGGNLDWLKRFVSILVFVFQYILPGAVISFCYISVSRILKAKADAKKSHGISKEREEAEARRNARTNKMLILMIVIFMACWLPWNVVLFAADISNSFSYSSAYIATFLVAHWIAMSSTVYNPLIYGWMNDNFRREFLKMCPVAERMCSCLETRNQNNRPAATPKATTTTSAEAIPLQANRTNCNANVAAESDTERPLLAAVENEHQV